MYLFRNQPADLLRAPTDKQHSFARELVETGRYSSVSAVLKHGIDLLRQRMQEHVRLMLMWLLASRSNPVRGAGSGTVPTENHPGNQGQNRQFE